MFCCVHDSHFSKDLESVQGCTPFICFQATEWAFSWASSLRQHGAFGTFVNQGMKVIYKPFEGNNIITCQPGPGLHCKKLVWFKCMTELGISLEGVKFILIIKYRAMMQLTPFSFFPYHQGEQTGTDGGTEEILKSLFDRRMASQICVLQRYGLFVEPYNIHTNGSCYCCLFSSFFMKALPLHSRHSDIQLFGVWCWTAKPASNYQLNVIHSFGSH